MNIEKELVVQDEYQACLMNVLLSAEGVGDILSGGEGVEVDDLVAVGVEVDFGHGVGVRVDNVLVVGSVLWVREVMHVYITGGACEKSL